LPPQAAIPNRPMSVLNEHGNAALLRNPAGE
jgi:hypothetical protein